MSIDAIAGNRVLWDELTPINERSAAYDLESFKAGRCTLYGIELDELGPEVPGKRLLHLQCHFGLDTLSWARMGARVTGVDLSPRSIELARTLTGELGLEADFVCSDLYELPEVVDETFEIVFSSWGVIVWLPDIRRWAEIVATYLEPGGVFYLAEFHPILSAYGGTDEPELIDSYFYRSSARHKKWDGAYADPEATVEHPSYRWTHPLGEIVTALIDAGLVIEFLHEHCRSPQQIRRWLAQDSDGWWVRQGAPLPLAFSLGARK